MINFKWDPVKAESNIKKHKVSFIEAKSVFYDEFAIQFFDDDCSESEDRFLMLGMRDEYDFSKMKSRKNSYASKLKKPVTIRLGEDVIDYFKTMSVHTGVPYQSLINLYLRDCAAHHKKIDISWQSQS
jgi:uncharacterized DUF497 family protein